MFQGDSVVLREVTRDAVAVARRLGHERVGAEHLLISLSTHAAPVGEVFDAHGLSAAGLVRIAGTLGPGGAGAAADRELLGAIGIEIDPLVGSDLVGALDTSPAHVELFPLGAAAARRRTTGGTPRLGLDFLAGYDAALRLALARRERELRPKHLALALAYLDAGARWMITSLGADPGAVADHLSARFPAPARNPLLRAERRIAGSYRARRLCVRHQHRTGRSARTSALVCTIKS